MRRALHRFALAVSPSPRPRRVALATSPLSRRPFVTRRPRPVASSSCLHPRRVTPQLTCCVFFRFHLLTGSLLSQVHGDHLPPADVRGSEAAMMSQLPTSPPEHHSRCCRRHISLVASPSSCRPSPPPHLSSRPPHHRWLDVGGNVGVYRCVPSSRYPFPLCVLPWDTTRHRWRPFCLSSCTRHNAPFPACLLGCDTTPPLPHPPPCALSFILF